VGIRWRGRWRGGRNQGRWFIGVGGGGGESFHERPGRPIVDRLPRFRPIRFRYPRRVSSHTLKSASWLFLPPHPFYSNSEVAPSPRYTCYYTGRAMELHSSLSRVCSSFFHLLYSYAWSRFGRQAIILFFPSPGSFLSPQWIFFPDRSYNLQRGFA